MASCLRGISANGLRWAMTGNRCSEILKLIYCGEYSVKGRPHYYSHKREEYAQIVFDLDAGTPIHILRRISPSFQSPPLTCTSIIRPILPLQLEHETALRVRSGDIPFYPLLCIFRIDRRQCHGIYHLGYYNLRTNVTIFLLEPESALLPLLLFLHKVPPFK